LGIIAGEDEAPESPLGITGYVQAAAVARVFAPVEREFHDMARDAAAFFCRDQCEVFACDSFILLLFKNTEEDVVKRLLELFSDHTLRVRGGSRRTGREAPDYRPYIALGSRRYLPPTDSPAQCREELRRTCHEARELLDRCFFYRDRKYVDQSAAQGCVRRIAGQGEPEPNAFRAGRSEVEELCVYIQIVDTKKTAAFFKALEMRYAASGKTPREIRRECLSFMAEIGDILTGKVPGLREVLEKGENPLEAILEKRYLGDIIDELQRVCGDLCVHTAGLSSESNFQRIISYIKNNYTEDLKLEALGQLFNCNSAYLGKRLKEYTGRSFHTWLDILRIEAAKELLLNTPLKVYEISTAAGYSSVDYFYSKFKKYAGKSPQGFRKTAE
jgi:AraC-like DNA-binding protein